MAYTQCFTHRDYQIAAPIPSVSYFTVEHKYRVLLLAPGGYSIVASEVRSLPADRVFDREWRSRTASWWRGERGAGP